MTETYINFNNLSGKELDEDFRRFCSEKGFDMNGKFSIVSVPCLTGHDSYIVNQEVVAKC
jgi:hypothetical protein